MTKSKREFGVYRAFFEKDALFVDGRCFEGPLSVGDVFQQVYHAKVVPPETVFISDVRQVKLRIEEILFYDGRIDSIDSGNTARLRLLGENAELVRNDSNEVLAIESEN